MEPIDRDTWQHLLSGVRISPRIKRELRFTPESIDDWSNRDFITVANKSRSEGVLVIPEGDSWRLLPYELHSRVAGQTGRVAAIICDLCSTWRRGTESAMITFRHPGTRSSTTYLCCGDLDCSLHVRSLTKVAVLSRTQLREVMSAERRIERLQEKLATL